MGLFPLLVVELVAGALGGVILFRLGMPSLAAAVIWVPLLGSGVDIAFVVGLIASGVWQLARPWIVDEGHFPQGVLIALACVGVGLILANELTDWFGVVEFFLPSVLVVAVASLVFFSPISRLRSLLAILLSVGVGWLLLQAWVIPLALSGLLMGLFGFFVFSAENVSAHEFVHPWRESALGVVLGVLPGLGPGLMGLLWYSKRFSPLTGIANLAFSVGYVVLSGKVRSMPAELLAGSTLTVEFIFVLLLGGVFIAWGLEQLLPRLENSPPNWIWVLLQVVGLFLLGNLSTLLAVGVGFALQRVFVELEIPPAWGLLCLIGPIVWFYS